MHNPVIGITLDAQIDSSKYAYSAYPWYALRQNYSATVAALGGIPLMLPFEQDLIAATLDLLDGIIITGGDFDIHPKHYGEAITSDKVVTTELRTDYEFALFKQARARKMPILGICNGMQVINVACGGSLIQHIPDHLPLSSIKHEQPYPKHTPTHQIEILPNTQLANITNNITTWSVNTTHHQAVKTLGKDLISSAIAPDGITEAIESTVDKFIIGVEWHPEYLACGELDKLIFEALLKQASWYRSAR